MNVLSFPGASIMSSSLPTEVVGALSPDTIESVVLDTAVCIQGDDGFVLQPVNPSLTTVYDWSGGSTGSTLSVSATGTYWVKYGNDCHSRVDTFKINVINLNPIITVDGFLLGVVNTYATYQWLKDGALIPGATDATLLVSENGNYQVAVTNGAGCADTSAVYEVTNANGISTVHPLSSRVSAYPNPATGKLYVKAPASVRIDARLLGIDGKVLLVLKDVRELSLHGLAQGLYLLELSDGHGQVIKREKIVKR